jgi:hypothetical protein
MILNEVDVAQHLMLVEKLAIGPDDYVGECYYTEMVCRFWDTFSFNHPLEILPPNAFTYKLYEAVVPFSVFVDDNLLFNWLCNFNVTGYNTESEYKPLKEYTAVMFNIDGEKCWTHIPNRVWASYFERREHETF